MTPNLQILENDHWRCGILPGTGASIAFGQVKRHSAWLDVLRPTPEADYDNSSNCSSFIMLPWCNRIRGGLLQFGGDTFTLQTTKDDGTARHGDVRRRQWNIESLSDSAIVMTLHSRDYADMNWPFTFSARAEYRLEGADFIWELALRSEDERPFPAGFGHHPYFVRPEGENAPQLTVPCSRYYQLTDFMPAGESLPIRADLDFRQPRLLGQSEINDVLTGRQPDEPSRIVYPQSGLTLEMHSDPLFVHILLFAPEGKPFFAVEPMTNVSDGFNLYAQGIPGSGVFVLHPGESQSATVRLNASYS